MAGHRRGKREQESQEDQKTNCKLTLDLDPTRRPSPQRISAKQFDNGLRTLKVVLSHGGSVYRAPEGATVVLRGTKPNGLGVLIDGTYSKGGYVFVLTENLLSASGEILCDVAVYGERADDVPVISSELFYIDNVRAGFNEATLIDSPEYSYLTRLIDEMQSYEVIPNPELDGTEEALMSVSIGGRKYKIMGEWRTDALDVDQL